MLHMLMLLLVFFFILIAKSLLDILMAYVNAFDNIYNIVFGGNAG